MSNEVVSERHELKCMEIWGGVGPVERSLATPGLDVWIHSQPYQGDDQGGDVYYMTLCGGGLITRIVLADISGHGSSVAEFSLGLRALLRKHINHKSQGRLVNQVNRQFGEMAQLRRFATALVATYLTSTDRLTLCNAGHPRPLHYKAADRTWRLLKSDDGADAAGDDGTKGANLPLGLDEETDYRMFDIPLGQGDLIVFYTDALIEAADADGRMLGEGGLLELAGRLGPIGRRPDELGPELLRLVSRHRQDQPADDDLTLILLHHNAGPSRRLSIAQKVDVYFKVFGLRPV